MNNLRQRGNGFQMYASQYRGTLPGDGDDGDKTSKPVGPWNADWVGFNAIPKMVASRPYVRLQDDDSAGREKLPIEGANSLFVCPSTSMAIGIPGKDTVDGDGYFMMYGNNALAWWRTQVRLPRFNERVGPRGSGSALACADPSAPSCVGTG